MPKRLEISLKDHLFDPEGASLCRKIADYFGWHVGQARVIHVLTLDVGLQDEEMEAVRNEIFTNPVGLFPEKLSLASYQLMFGTLSGSKMLGGQLFQHSLTVYIRNSFIIALGEVLLQVPVVVGLAYACARLHTPRVRKVIFYFAIATMMLPGTVKLVPNFLLLTHFPWPTDHVPSVMGVALPSVSLVGSFTGVIIPGMFSGFNFLILKSFFDGIDKEYLEAARLDGAKELDILILIMLPLSRPVIAYVCYTTFCGGWNSFMGPWIILQSEPDKWPLSVIMMQLVQSLTATGAASGANTAADALRASGAGYNALMGIALIESLPIVALFIFFREQIMKGVKLQGLKG